MRIQNHSRFIFPSLLCFLVIFPSFVQFPLNIQPVFFQEENLDIYENDSEFSSLNYLFYYASSSEKESLVQVLSLYNPLNLYFYKNFPIGFVTLQQEKLDSLLKSYPSITSCLHPSQKIQMLPSIESLSPQAINEIQDLTYVPPANIIGASDLWQRGITGTNSKIAIIDGGIDSTHEDFTDRIAYTKSFIKEIYGFDSEEDVLDRHGHGTHVAGIAAGAGAEYTGIAYNADLYILKAADLTGSSTESAILAAIDEAITLGVDVISISLGDRISSPWDTADVYSLALDRAVDLGISVVSSAGNEGSEGEFASISSPGSFHKGLSVGATNGSTNIVSFSSRGPTFDYKVDPDIVAPGYGIVGPLADGVVKLAFNSLVGWNLDKYIILSGTSMAAPIVSGAIALLKQQFPTASPSAIRAALQESAHYMAEESLYEQGSGLINVLDASNILQNSIKNSEFEIISSLPRAGINKPIEFVERVKFPGDSTQFGLSFVTGKGGIITRNISNSMKNFIEMNTTPITLSQGGGYYSDILNISVPLSTDPGNYFGNISYTFNNTTYFLPLNFTIEIPKAKIYLYSHNLHSDDSEFYNYRSLGYTLSTIQFDMDEYPETIRWENLSKNDILILSDLEYPLSSQELAYISAFHDQNGSILLVTSAFPYFSPEPYSQLGEMLDFPINFNDRIDIINFTDNGRDRVAVPVQGFNVTWEEGNPLFNGLEQLDLSFGAAFAMNTSDLDVKHLGYVASNGSSNYYSVAGYEPKDKGKVLVLGNEHWIYQSFIESKSGPIFIKNAFNWLKPSYNLSINSRITPLRDLEIFAYSFENLTSLTVDIAFGNGSSLTGIPFVYDNVPNCYNISLKLGVEEDQEILLQIKNGSKKIKEFSLFEDSLVDFPKILDFDIDYISTINVHKPRWVGSSMYNQIIDLGLNFTLNHESSQNITSLVIMSNDLEETMSIMFPPIESIQYFFQESKFSNSSNSEQLFSWTVPSQLSTGFYYWEVQVWYKINSESNLSILLANEKGNFILTDPEPYFNRVQSTIGGLSLDQHYQIGTTVDMPSWSSGSNVEIKLVGEDENSDEFEVYVQLLHYYLWIANKEVLDSFEIPSSEENGKENVGIFNVPESPIPLPDENDVYVEIYDHIFVLVMYIRDKQGNYDLDAVYFSIDPPALDMTLIYIAIITGVAVLAGIVVYLTIIFRRNTKSVSSIYSLPDYYSHDNETTSPFQKRKVEKHCNHCGAILFWEARYCETCGKSLITSSDKPEFRDH